MNDPLDPEPDDELAPAPHKTAKEAEPGMDDIERLLKAHVENEDPDAASDLLKEAVFQHVAQRRFEEAEALREKLFEIDPIPMNKIIETAECIEREKNRAIDKAHQATFTAFYDGLTVEEANAFYHSLKSADFDANRCLIRKGASSDRLYFIEQGELKMIHEQQGKEILLALFGPGDIVGQDTFFSISECTTTVWTQSPVKTCFLTRDVLESWSGRYPGIVSKLTTYCESLKTAGEFVAEKEVERRHQERIDFFQRAVIQPVGETGIPTGNSFKGDIAGHFRRRRVDTDLSIEQTDGPKASGASFSRKLSPVLKRTRA